MSIPDLKKLHTIVNFLNLFLNLKMGMQKKAKNCNNSFMWIDTKLGPLTSKKHTNYSN